MRGIKLEDERKREKLVDKVLVLYVLDDKSVSEIHEETGIPRKTINNWLEPYRFEDRYSYNERLRFGRLVSKTCSANEMSRQDFVKYMNISKELAHYYIHGFSIPSERGRRKKLLDLINSHKREP